MSPDRQRKVVEILEAALELDGEARGEFIERASGGDPSVRDEVWSLILHDEEAGSFIERPAVDFGTKAITDGRPGLAEGSSLGPYQILRHLGEGGMGVVYLARDARLDRPVALKLLPEQFTEDKDKVRRFELEARAASRLQHNNIITIYDIGRAGRVHYIVTEYVEGQTLRERLSGGPLDAGEVLEIVGQVASALQAAHEAGIVHRDIKPENIMVRRDGVVKVLDFGVAKLAARSAADSNASTIFHTRPGVLIGTPSYMSPEQVAGAPVDARSDLFSLGAVLYECVTSRSPFTGQNVAAVWGQIQHVDPPPPSTYNPRVPPQLDRIVLKALAKSADERYQSSVEMVQALEAARAALRNADQTRLGQAVRRAKRFGSPTFLSVKLRQSRFITVSLLVLLGLVGLWVGSRWWRPAPHAPSPAALHWYQEGEKALRDGTYHKARMALESAIALDDKYALAHARLAEAWMELDYTERAKDEILLAKSLAPDPSLLPPLEALYLEAVTSVVMRDYKRAIQNYQEIVGVTPEADKPYAYLDLGRTYEKNEDVKNAIVSYQEAANRNPQYSAAFSRLGILHGRAQELSSAMDAFEQAEQLYNSSSNFEGVAEVLYQRGSLLNRIGEIAKARTQLERALNITQTTNNLYQRIRAQLSMSSVAYAEGNTEQAKRYAGEAVELARSNGIENLATQGLIDLGAALYGRREYVEAEQYFRQALEFARRAKGQRNEALALLALGRMYIQQEVKVDEALQHTEQALAFFRQGGYGPEISEALRLRGLASLIKGDYDSARREFEQQLKHAGEVGDTAQLANAHLLIGDVLAERELYPEALKHYDESYTLDRTLGRQLHMGYGLLNRSGMLWRVGSYQEAREMLGQVPAVADRLDSNYRHVLLMRGYLTHAQLALSEHRFEEAVSKGRQALSMAGAQYKTTAIEATYTLGLAQARSQAKRQGRLMCAEAVEMSRRKDDPRLLSNALLALTEALYEDGDMKAALTTALEAQGRFERSGQPESNWRAHLLAGRAGQRMNDRPGALDHFRRAGELLSNLRQVWGAEAFDRYLTRIDIQSYRNQLNEALAAP